MKYSKKLTGIVLVVLCLLQGCGFEADKESNNQNNNMNLFEKICSNSNEKRRQTIATSMDYDFSAYEAGYKDELDAFTEEEIKNIVTKKEQKDVSKEQAIEDTEMFFKMLKISYGAYIYYGGDEAFSIVKADIINDINALASDIVSVDSFKNIIISRLSALVLDGHFKINGEKLCYTYVPYLCNDYDVNYKDDNYYLKVGSDEYKIISIDGSNDLSEYIRYTIKPDGSIGYGFYHLIINKQDENQTSIVKVKSLLSSESFELNWIKAEPIDRTGEDEYYKNTVNGIDVYTVTSMVSDGNELTQFSESAAEAKNKNIFIMDIRGNRGGNDIYMYDWFTTFTGQTCKKNRLSISKDTPLSSSATIETCREIGMGEKEIEDIKLMFDAYEYTGNYMYGTKNSALVKNDIKIFVLMDKEVGSSGESIVETLRTMENVVFIGTNSYGRTLVSNNSFKYLPNSGLQVYFGQDVVKGIDFQECIGYIPDIWVDPQEALDLTLKMIEYYNLNK